MPGLPEYRRSPDSLLPGPTDHLITYHQITEDQKTSSTALTNLKLSKLNYRHKWQVTHDVSAKMTEIALATGYYLVVGSARTLAVRLFSPVQCTAITDMGFRPSTWIRQTAWCLLLLYLLKVTYRQRWPRSKLSGDLL